MKNLHILTLVVISLLLSSCVAKKKYAEEVSRNKNLSLEKEAMMETLSNLTATKADLEEKNDQLTKAITDLRDELGTTKTNYEREKATNEELNKLYDELVDQNKKLLSSSSREKQRLLTELENKKRELMLKEQAMSEEQAKIDQLTKELKEREQRVNELEALVNKKDEALANLKKKIEDALLSFDKDELSVEVRNGKLYVSLSEKLLFSSGSTVVDKKGQDALKKLAAVLGRQTDIDILIEGHTDDVPIKTACIKDNWDLSVLRATAIVRILKSNKDIAPDRFIASGRGEFVPVESNDTKEGKAKNRRTEVILAPNLDEIFKILESDNN